MNKEARIKALESSPDTGELKTIKYKGDKLLKVKEIPLRALLYNPFNGRIRSSVLSYETKHGAKLNPEVEKDKFIIEQYLFDSAENKNEKTIASLREKGQQEIGIVTKDGVIIDGNRRALLLNVINKEDSSEIPFKAIVLPDEMHGNERDIILLETGYQMGVDNKADYNPIEKYLRCQELRNNFGMTPIEIADLMSESSKRIIEWLSILELMKDYLTRLTTPEIYTRLEKREGHFVDLYRYIKTYSTQKKPSELTVMKNIYFDYIRLGVPVQKARIIANSNKNSLFNFPNIWTNFVSEHNSILLKYNEPTFNSFQSSHQEKTNEDVFRNMDKIWKEKIGEDLFSNFSSFELILKEILELLTPIKILKNILINLNQLNKDKIKSISSPEPDELLNKIINRAQELL